MIWAEGFRKWGLLISDSLGVIFHSCTYMLTPLVHIHIHACADHKHITFNYLCGSILRAHVDIWGIRSLKIDA